MNKKSSYLTNILNHRIELWKNVSSKDVNDLGIHPNVAYKAASMWAAIIPQTGSLLSGRTAETTLSRTTHKIVVRYREDIKPSDWFVYKGERYNILYIMDPYVRRERLEIFCEAVSTR